MKIPLLRYPSALIPIGMSAIALSVVLGHIAMYGVQREADEGAAAHIRQLLMAGQAPVIVFFALRWIPRAPKPGLIVLGLQIVAALAALAPVYLLGM